MSLQDWKNNGWLKPHCTSAEEIANLFAIAQRDLSNAANQGLSADWKFGIAYNAALKLCTIVLYAEGYCPENSLAHYRTIMSLKEVDCQNWKDYATYLNACRIKRNTMEYDKADVIPEEDAIHLLRFTTSFSVEVKDFITKKHPEVLSSITP